MLGAILGTKGKYIWGKRGFQLHILGRQGDLQDKKDWAPGWIFTLDGYILFFYVPYAAGWIQGPLGFILPGSGYVLHDEHDLCYLPFFFFFCSLRRTIPFSFPKHNQPLAGKCLSLFLCIQTKAN